MDHFQAVCCKTLRFCCNGSYVSVGTWSLFFPESDSEGVGSDSEGDPLSSPRSLEEPRAFFGGGGR